MPKTVWDEDTRRRVTENNPELTELRLNANKIDDETACEIANSLRCNTTIKVLHMWSNCVGDDGAKEIARALGENNSLTTLLLFKNEIGAAGASSLFDALSRNTSLKKLNLRKNNIGDVAEICDTLIENNTLTAVNLGENQIGPAAASSIASALCRFTTLTELHLYGNPIGDEGAASLAKALGQNSSLVELDLRATCIGCEGAAEISAALCHNDMITTLDFGRNPIGAAGARSFANALIYNSTLRKLSLCESFVGDRGAVLLADALRQNSSITALDLRANLLGDEGWRAFANALEHNITIIHLELSDSVNPYDDVVTELKESHFQVWQLLQGRGDGGAADEKDVLLPHAVVAKSSVPDISSVTYGTLVGRSEWSKGATSTLAGIIEDEITSAAESGSEGGERAVTDYGDAAYVYDESPSNTRDQFIEELPRDGVPASAEAAVPGSRDEFGNEKDSSANGKGPLVSQDTGNLPFNPDLHSAATLHQTGKVNDSSGYSQNMDDEVLELDADERSLIVRVREDHSTVASVHLRDKKLGGIGAKTLADALHHNSYVKVLRLDNACIGDQGVKSLAVVLRGNSALSKIYLTGNAITDVGATALAEALGCNSSVKFLALGGNLFGDMGVTAVANKALHPKCAIKELCLEWNAIGIKGAAELALALKRKVSLRVLKVDYTGIGDQGATKFAEALRMNQTLTKLYVRGNKISDDGARAFKDALQFNEVLSRLNLSNNEICSGDLLAKIKQLLDRNEGYASSSAKPWTKEESNRICVLFSDPFVWLGGDGTTHPFPRRLDLTEERSMMSRVVSVSQMNIELSYAMATRARLSEFLTSRCAVLHYSGHGGLYENGESFLAFEDERGSGSADFLSPEEIRQFLKHPIQGSLQGPEPFKLVFVSSCHSEEIGKAFVSAGVRHVVCCRQSFELNDAVCARFAYAFYGALVDGCKVTDAFHKAKQAVAIVFCSEEAFKFLLLPEEEEHDVAVFDPSPSEEGKECMAEHTPVPLPPVNFFGRETILNSVLFHLLSKERLVTVFGESGIGRSSLASAVYHHIADRRSSIPNIDTLFYIKRDRTICDLNISLLAPLYEKLKAAGLGGSGSQGGSLREIICSSLNDCKALLVLDGIDGLEDAAGDFLRLLFDTSTATKVLLTGTRRTSFRSSPVVETRFFHLEGLDLEKSSLLFSKMCHYADTRAKQLKLQNAFLFGNSFDKARTKSIVERVREGMPSKIIDAARTISNEEYEELIDIGGLT